MNASEPLVRERAGAALIIVSGLPGAGKTTYAKRIATARSAMRLSPDDWLQTLGFGVWDAEMRERIERLQRSVAEDALLAGATVVIEWGTWARVERDALRDLARGLDARAELVMLEAAVDTLYRRVTDRGVENPPITLAQLQDWNELFERADENEAATYDAFERVVS